MKLPVISFVLVLGLAFSATLAAQSGDNAGLRAKPLLGRPTDRSVTINAEPDGDLELYFEYGREPGLYEAQSAAAVQLGGVPFNTVLDGLEPDTRYYYRVRYRRPGEEEFQSGAEATFQTQRRPGSSFSFAIQFDPHMDDNSDPEMYRLTLRNELEGNPDFVIDLGDTFMSDKLHPPTAPAVLDRVLLLRSYYELACHSAPLFLTLGNHEGEWGRFLDGSTENVALWDARYRMAYFPNPVPDGFYSGDSQVDALAGQRQSYYAWTWGDALFVVLDPYWNRTAAPDKGGDWALTLGREQYDWLKLTLEQSTALYKFVFCHNLVGGLNMNGPMRGGIEVARFLEWGGYNLDDSWGFDTARPGWPMPIHQLLVANRVTAFFHGHDHLYARQELDGVVYQEGPQPSARNLNLGTRAAEYGYTHGTLLGGAGYLKVQVGPAQVQVDYIQTWTPDKENATRSNGMVADSYIIPAPQLEP